MAAIRRNSQALQVPNVAQVRICIHGEVVIKSKINSCLVSSQSIAFARNTLLVS